MYKVYLSLGSNLGNKEDNLDAALENIEKKAGKVISRSSFFYSEPWGFSSDNNFVNICALIHTEMDPFDLLNALKEIETQMGRLSKRDKNGYADRIIDIDILLIDDLVIDTDILKIPHQLMKERDFVKIPHSEII